MKKKIVLYGGFTDSKLAALRAACPEGFETCYVDKNEDPSRLADTEYMICRAPVDRGVLDAAPKLKVIQKWGVGYDKIDIEEAGKRNIPVMISSGGNSMPVAELTVALMLDVLRNVTVQCEKLKEGNWAREQYAAHSYMLHGKTVGLIGMGNIARKVAAIVVRGFGCNVLYYDLIHLSDEEERKLQVKSVSLDQLLAESDIVSIHIPLLESTEGMIDRSKIMLMKQNACLINTSRGRVVNEQDLVEALRAKRILGAGLDTFSVEPLPQNSPLLTMENVIVTPHCGGNTADNDDNMARICMNLITEYANSGNANKQATVNAAYLR